MQEIVQEVLAYLQSSPVLNLAVAFIAGLAATKTVAYEGKASVVVFLIVGLIGLFLSQFVMRYFGLNQYLEKFSEFQIIFDFIAAYIGSFVIAAIIHFVKPT